MDYIKLENTHSRRTLRRTRRTDICLERLGRMCQERVGLTNGSHDQQNRIMYGALVESPSCISSFSGRQSVRELLRRNRPMIAWCEHVVTLGCFTTCLVLVFTPFPTLRFV